MDESALAYYTAYGDLMNSRAIGMSVGPVPVSEVAAYLTVMPGLNPQLLIRFVKELDAVYLEHVAQTRQRPKKPASRPTVRTHGNRRT